MAKPKHNYIPQKPVEVWKDIKGYNGSYQVSNMGRVKSLKGHYPRILKRKLNLNGYPSVELWYRNKQKTFTVHYLVAHAFLNHSKKHGYDRVVNHIDHDRTNNNLPNLEIVSQRENANQKHLKSSSKYTGVAWCKKMNKWKSYIRIDGRLKHLGYFSDEAKASEAYINKLNEINDSRSRT